MRHGENEAIVDYKKKIHAHIQAAADELLAFVRSCEADYVERWVPTVHVKDALELNFVATPQQGRQYGPKGWLFAILARVLEDQGVLEHKKVGNRSYCRSRAAA
ncbi:hypothetical protein NB709_003488 [Xanthomonas sacchari]|nr:hypothetical protein [Xanthomonas sacchari]